MRTIALLTITFLLFAIAPAHADEQPFVHQLFTDHMVLQRGVDVPVWGWAKSGEVVTVAIGDTTATATADADGSWMARLGELEAGGPHELTISGPQSVTIKDVLVGDVWICSGQSNMEWPVAASNNAQIEIEAASHPTLRLFTVPKRVSGEPQSTIASQWQVCSPETIPRFSAVGYFFGRKLNQTLDVPIGLIHTSWGGTIAEAWTSAEALVQMEDFRGPVQMFQRQVEAQKRNPQSYERQLAAWWEANDAGSKNNNAWAAIDVDDVDWKTMALPANWENAGLPDYDGVVWFRRTVELDKSAAGQPAILELGPIDDIDTTWVNGKEVGGLTNWQAPRKYTIPAGTLTAGKNVIAVRVLDTSGGGGIFGTPDQMKLTPQGSAAVPLAGDWRYAATVPLAKAAPMPQRTGNNPNVVTVLYNGMLAPIVPYGIKGAIWYQGESNAGRAEQYGRLLPTLINDWRTRFGYEDFSFHIVQLANFMQEQTEPVQDGWAQLREAQTMTAAKDPQVGLAVITDIGEANDIHPRNKQDVGTRLALQALEISYGHQNLVSSGPVLESMEVVGAEAHLTFREATGILEAKGDKVKGFAVAGTDGRFVWANATIDGSYKVVVSSPEVSKPATVRYNWANNPIGNLFNRNGLPAGPFRTDGR